MARMFKLWEFLVGSVRIAKELFADVRQKILLHSFMFYDYIMRLMNSLDG